MNWTLRELEAYYRMLFREIITQFYWRANGFPHYIEFIGSRVHVANLYTLPVQTTERISYCTNRS